MKPVFADTAYFVALCGPNDTYHERAAALSRSLIAGVITTEYVVVETGGAARVVGPVDAQRIYQCPLLLFDFDETGLMSAHLPLLASQFASMRPQLWKSASQRHCRQ